MTPSQTTASCPDRTAPSRWDDSTIAAALAAFGCADASSQRQYASDHDVPRSTLGYWLRKDAPQGLDPQLVDFFRSAAGVAFLTRLMLALFLVFHFRSACGLRGLGLFLRLAQLDRFVASSYSALRKLALEIERGLIGFERRHRPRLAQEMAPRSIAVCLDENYHRKSPYLVGMEPASNFIALETHAPSRDGPTWTQELEAATADLKVKVVLVCSDRARGIIACAENGLVVLHSPDLMHMQRDILQPLLLPLRRQADEAQGHLEKRQEAVEALQAKQQAYQADPRLVGRLPGLGLQIRQADAAREKAQQEQQQCQRRREQAGEAIRELADQAHPFDGKTGEPLQANAVGERVDRSLARLEKVVEEANLPEKANLGVAKGYGWVTSLMALVTWFWQRVGQRLGQMNLSEEAERAFKEQLLPGIYWQQHCRRGRDAEQKGQRKELSERLLKAAWQKGGALDKLGEQEKREVVRQAKQLAGLFARSSSCVEGRNGRLSLLQHGHVRLSKQTLQAQTVIHNYMLEREDGTTAAERFFGKEHEDLFEDLLARMPNLPRPAAKRPRKGLDGPAKAA